MIRDINRLNLSEFDIEFIMDDKGQRLTFKGENIRSFDINEFGVCFIINNNKSYIVIKDYKQVLFIPISKVEETELRKQDVLN